MKQYFENIFILLTVKKKVLIFLSKERLLLFILLKTMYNSVFHYFENLGLTHYFRQQNHMVINISKHPFSSFSLHYMSFF